MALCNSVLTSKNLNKITQKDQYLIPLITNLLEQLGSHKVHQASTSMLATYNVHIAASHEWKTAFQMHYGFLNTWSWPMDLPMLLLHCKPS